MVTKKINTQFLEFFTTQNFYSIVEWTKLIQGKIM